MDSLAFRRSLIRAFGSFHAWAYEASAGRWGGQLLGLPMVLLHLVGRKSGKPRWTPLLYLKVGEDLVIVASFYGSPSHPAWYHNLMANPECDIRQGQRRYRVRARTATSEERQKLWPRLVAFYPDYAIYQSRTDREIPVVILSPVVAA
ncbi:MAG: nitroreductase family deazaflavin-dependent oxidoreductase [Planctomycetota bacterium]|jgi:deazaflavin-dependent oxidoreductase (nitroreductase family)